MHAGREIRGAGMQADAHTEPAPCDIAIDEVANLRLEHLHLAREVHRDFALLAVHRTEFHGDLEAILGAIPAPITRHRFHRGKVWGKGGHEANKIESLMAATVIVSRLPSLMYSLISPTNVVFMP